MRCVDPFGQKKTVYATFRALESCTTSTNHFSMNASGILRGLASFLLQREQKDTENRGRLTFTNILLFEPIFGSNGLKQT